MKTKSKMTLPVWKQVLLGLAFGGVIIVVIMIATCERDDSPSEAAQRLPATIAGAKVDNKMITRQSASRVEYFVRLVKERGGVCHTIHGLQSRVKNGRGGFFMTCDNYANSYNIDKNANGFWVVSRH